MITLHIQNYLTLLVLNIVIPLVCNSGLKTASVIKETVQC